MSGGRVAVVGGGVGGVTAALACRDAGAAVTLLEVRPRLGGAASSYPRGELEIDTGQHVFLRCCTAYRRHLERIGAGDLVLLQERLDIPVLVPGRRPARLRRDRLPAPLHLARALGGYRPLRGRERASAALAALRMRRLDPDDGRLDAETLAARLAAWRQSPAAVERLWNLIALPALNLPADEASLMLAVRVFRTGLLDRADAGDIGWARAPLSRIHHEAALAALARAGVDVRLSTRVDAVAPAAGGVELATAAGPVRADAAIVALPPARAAAVLPPAARPAAASIAAAGSSPIVNVHVIYDRRVLDEPFAAAVGSPVQFVFDRTRQAGLAEGQYLAVSQSAAVRELAERPDALAERMVAALGALLPRARAAGVREAWVTREHAATFRGVPGTAAERPAPATAAPGVFVAGAWTRTGWPATLEGAARSGEAAARAALGWLDAGRSATGAPDRVAA